MNTNKATAFIFSVVIVLIIFLPNAIKNQNNNSKHPEMKTIIETNETNLASIQFKKSNKVTDWQDLSREEQEKLLNTLSAYYDLYAKFIKPE